MKLRDYQELALSEIKAEFKKGNKKVLLHLATGSGKTVIFSQLLKLVAKNNKRAGMVVRGKQLVQQASDRLTREGVSHGVIQGNHPNYHPDRSIQLCSVDTLIRRKIKPDFNLLVIDEADLATTGNFKKLVESYPNAFILSVTATPFGKEPLNHLADVVVHPISFEELIDQGYLSPLRYFAPSKPDLTGVHTRMGDYVTDELETKMNILTGDLVSHYRDIAMDRPTIVFAVNIRHSKSIAARFNSSGIPAQHIEGNDSLKIREEYIEKLKSGELKIITSVGTLCRGVDIPELGCLILARPTKSYNLFVQQLGRGTRITDKYKDCIILDHAGNLHRHGFPTDEPNVYLDGKIPDPKFKVKTCSTCYAVYEGFKCPQGCQPIVLEPKKNEMIEINGQLIEINSLPHAVKIKQYIESLKTIQKQRGYKRGWVYHTFKNKHGEELAARFFPKRKIPDFIRRRLSLTQDL